MAVSCSQENCTVAETGRCLLNNDPANCPNRLSETADVLGSPVLEPPRQVLSLKPSLTLGAAEASAMMSARQCMPVGILGLPGSGKTAALVSLYLLSSIAKLTRFEFRDSSSLMAFEQISRGARRWDPASVAEQLTARTEIADGRSPAFLHLRLFSESLDKTFDVLLPDLPGEWTSDLVNENRVDRLEFLRSCAQIWVFVDGRVLLAQDSRNTCISTTDILVRRVGAMLGSACPPIKIVITHADSGHVDNEVFAGVSAKANANGMSLAILRIASFSDSATIPAGTGISELLDSLVTQKADEQAMPHPSLDPTRRAILNFRGEIGE